MQHVFKYYLRRRQLIIRVAFLVGLFSIGAVLTGDLVESPITTTMGIIMVAIGWLGLITPLASWLHDHKNFISISPDQIVWYYNLFGKKNVLPIHEVNEIKRNEAGDIRMKVPREHGEWYQKFLPMEYVWLKISRSKFDSTEKADKFYALLIEHSRLSPAKIITPKKVVVKTENKPPKNQKPGQISG